MIRRACLLLAALTASILVVSAKADPGQAFVSNSVGRPSGGKKVFAMGDVELRRAAACVLSIVPNQVHLYLATPPMSLDQIHVYGGLTSRLNNCVGNQAIGFDFPALRGALATAIYIRDYPTDPDFARAQTAVLPPVWLTAAKKSALVAYELDFQDFADCVVDAAPSDAASFIRSDPESPQEAQAIAGLMPHLAPCLISGRQLKLNAATLRAYLPEAVLRKIGTFASVQSEVSTVAAR